jgi:hypothetical protein
METILFYFFSKITAASGTVDSTLSRAWQLSPRKLAKSPKTASLLSLDAMERLPYVCPWCLKWFFSSLANHICSGSHTNHIFHKKYIDMMTEDPVEFKKACAKANTKGRLRNNIRALKQKDRPIIPARRTKDTVSHIKNLVWCTICNKPVAKKSYKEQHLVNCAKKKEVRLTPETKTVLLRNVDTLVEEESVTVARLLNTLPHSIRVILIDLRVDRLALTQFVVNDKVARAMLIRVAFTNSGKFNWLQDIRKRLRLLYQIFMYFVAVLGDKVTCVLDIMVYDVYRICGAKSEMPAIVECCHAVCEKDELEPTFAKFNEVMMFSSLLKTVSDIIENHLFHATEVRDKWTREGHLLLGFLESPSWKMFTVRAACRQKSLKVTFKKVIVEAKDFEVYLNLIERLSREHYARLLKAYAERNKMLCRTAHGQLVESLPTAIGTFTYRRVTEPFQFTLRDFEERPDLQEMLQQNGKRFSQEATNEVQKVFVLESRGKGDNPVMSVVKMEWMEPMAFLSDGDFRTFIGIPAENKLVFAKLNSRYGLGHANASQCQAKFARMCKDKVKNHLHLRTRNFRVSCASRLGGMQLTHTTTKLLCDLFGHSRAVHEKIYEIPQPLQMAAMMGFMCHASANDMVSSLTAKTIEGQLKMKIDDRDTLPANDK